MEKERREEGRKIVRKRETEEARHKESQRKRERRKMKKRTRKIPYFLCKTYYLRFLPQTLIIVRTDLKTILMSQTIQSQTIQTPFLCLWLVQAAHY